MSIIIDVADPDIEMIKSSIRKELQMIWEAHKSVGIEGGVMHLYTEPSQENWRSQEEGVKFRFDSSDEGIDSAVEFAMKLYKNGELPNSSVLLNPVVYEVVKDEEAGKERLKPIGSGLCWATSFILGVAEMTPDQRKRLDDLGVLNSRYIRGSNQDAGLKIIAFSEELLPCSEDGFTVKGCKELYSLSGIESDMYAPYYPLSGLNYLCTHGIFTHKGIDAIIPESERDMPIDMFIAIHKININKVLDAATCWEAYDKQHILYERFGQNPADIEHNSKLYDLCARNIELFNRTGPMREGSDETFEFIVPGLIPRGAVTLLAAPGGAGKSSVAHHLCVMASIDMEEGEPVPHWLGQPINMDAVKDGICVYFSGEDGPAIINARSKLFDPEGRSKRLQFHRTEFLDKDMTFPEYLKQLQEMPNVPICVIDPARKYLSGDEDDAEVVSEFFEAIEEFAIRKNTAMIVVHHLQKGAKPKNSREVLDELRGSQVFIDRPRVVIGMCRDGIHTVVGLAKNNIPPNMGMVTEERVFARNPKNLQLLWLPGDEGIRQDNLDLEEIQKLEAEEMQILAEQHEKITSVWNPYLAD